MNKKSTAKAGTVAGQRAGKGGQQIRSKGTGRGLQTGKGKGPIGLPVKKRK